MQPSRRPSLLSPSSLPSSHHPSQKQIEPAFDCQRIQKYIQLLKQTFRNRLKEKKYLFEQNEIKEVQKIVKYIHNLHQKKEKENQILVAELKTNLEQLQNDQDDTVNALRRKLEQEISEKEREWSQKMLALNNDKGRKEQAYKETIEKLMNALASAQKSHQQLQVKLNNQMQLVTKTLKQYSQIQRRDHYVANAIHDLVQEIALRQQNSLISSKSAEQLSLEEIYLPLSKPQQPQERDSCIDITETCLQKQLQAWLVRLICFGLFNKDNEECLKKMISFTKTYQQPTELLQEKIFPVMMEMLCSNMLKHQEHGWRYLQGSSSIRDCWEGSQIQLRNIDNLSELDINNWDSSVVDSSREEAKKTKMF